MKKPCIERYDSDGRHERVRVTLEDGTVVEGVWTPGYWVAGGLSYIHLGPTDAQMAAAERVLQDAERPRGVPEAGPRKRVRRTADRGGRGGRRRVERSEDK